MVRRDVEGGEVVEIVLDIRPLGDREAHLAEDRRQLVDRLADRMDAPGRLGRAGSVTSIRSRPGARRGRPRERAAARLDGRGDLVLDGVEAGAGRAAAPPGSCAPSPFIRPVISPFLPSASTRISSRAALLAAAAAAATHLALTVSRSMLVLIPK
jgi:hypothetical protein